MKNALLIICFLGSWIISKSQSPNLGFESIQKDQALPTSWMDWSQNFLTKKDSIVHRTGKYSVKISSPDDNSLNGFGCVAYELPAIYAGKIIELKGYMKLEDVKSGFAGLMLRIDGNTGLLQFENMEQKNISGSLNWKQYSIKLPYPKDAKSIYVGAILIGNGRIWIDDLNITIDGIDISKAKRRKILGIEKDKAFENGSLITHIDYNSRTLEDLEFTCKVWGFLKYYHPEIGNGKFNWDYQLFRILPKIINSKSLIERDSILLKWINNLGTYKINLNSEKKNDNSILQPDFLWLDSGKIQAKLKSKLVQIKNAIHSEQNYYVSTDPYIGNTIYDNENPYSMMPYPDLGYRILSLFRYWNAIEYFYPYKHLMDTKWDLIIKEYLPKFIESKNELEYISVIKSLIYKTNDGHSRLYLSNPKLTEFYSPIKVSYIENQLIVTGYFNRNLGEKSGLKYGDLILKINNNDVFDLIDSKKKSTAGSNIQSIYRNICRDLMTSNDTSILITFNRKGRDSQVLVKCYPNELVFNSFDDTCFKYINTEIAYLNLMSIKVDYIDSIMESLLNTKGLIIDLRGYPSDFVVHELSNYLIPSRIQFVKFSLPKISKAGEFNIDLDDSCGMYLPNYYKGRIVILVDENTVSQSEYTVMALENSPNAIVLGSITAGADGNVSQIGLPGGIMVTFTGIGVYYPDGNETQRCGIRIDVESRPTLKGIIDGKDEVLDNAVDLLLDSK